MTKKIVLVQPGKYGQLKPVIPLRCLYLSSVLVENGYRCEILDMTVDDYRNYNLDDILCVGISTMSGDMIKYALKFAKFLRQSSPKIPIIWGGVHPSLLPEQTIDNQYVDVVVRGEGEMTLRELVNAIQNGKPLRNIKGITFKEDGRVVNNPNRSFMDLNTVPIKLPYDLIKINRYNLSEFPIHTSRGCPHRCRFCYNLAYNGTSYRYKSAERVLDEIEYVLKNFSVQKITFDYEDNFFVSKDRVRKICEGMIKRGLNVAWGATCRFDYASKYDEAFLELLEKSGCSSLFFGGESGSQEILDSTLNKGIKLEQVLETTKRLSKTNITELVSFMCGLPGESYEDFLVTCDLIDQLCRINSRVWIAGILFYTPFPGTDLFEEVKGKYGFLPPQTLEEWQEYRPFRDVGCTWLDKRLAKMFRGVSVMSRFPFYKDNAEIPYEQYRATPYKQIYKILSHLARLRWKHRFFKFPIEWRLLEKAMERWRGYV